MCSRRCTDAATRGLRGWPSALACPSEVSRGSVNSGRVYQASRGLSLPERRQKFHFDFLNHTLKQAEWTFRLSVLFMTGGSLIILAGGVLALVHAGNPDLSYLPLVTSLTGALITIGGGALALHSKRTMANLTKARRRSTSITSSKSRRRSSTGLRTRSRGTISTLLLP